MNHPDPCPGKHPQPQTETSPATHEQGLAREALRQQRLLAVLQGECPPAELRAWLGGAAAQQQRGLHAYRANAAAGAERALATAYPTLRQLMGADSFAALANAHWQQHPPQRGDLGDWGAALPQAIAQADQLAGEPYLSDVARLEWALHQAERADDDDAPPTGLALLAQADPATLVLRLRAGHAVLMSAYPVHTLWCAHQRSTAGRFEPVRQALAAQRGEAVRVRRHGLQAVADLIDQDTAGFELDLLQGQSLDTALTRAGSGFAFEPWFTATLRRDGLAGVCRADIS